MGKQTHNELHKLVLSAFLFGAIFIIADVGRAQEALPPIVDEDPLSDENVELLTRGPLHEAFATSAPSEPQPGIVVQKKPPTDIEEIPPTYESVDGNEQDAVWIPGYWSWDDEREDYIWVSGAWRIVPVDRRWVPGYWNETSEGWQWVSGFWAPADVEQLDYVEPPPPTLEAGPSIPAPSQNHFWIPGTWIYQSHAYNWRPGYWCPFEENRVWIPAHYAWTPSGCLFVDGYWDYVLPQRGYLYAPVYFHRPVTYYRPRCGIRLSNLLLHLFVSRHHGHYFFGDYYDYGYRHRGRYPLHQYNLAARRYDPLLTYYDVHYGRHGINSRARLRGWHDYYSSHADHRPPRTWSAQLRFSQDNGAHRYHSRTVLASAPKPHREGIGRPHQDGRSERHRVQHEQLRDVAKHRKTLEAKNKDKIAKANGRAEHLRLPRHLRTDTRRGDAEVVNAGAGKRTKLSREDRLNAGRAGGNARSPGDQREPVNASPELGKRAKGDLVGKGRNRKDGRSQVSVDVRPQVRAALEDRGQVGELIKSRANKKVERPLNTAKIKSTEGKQEVRKPETSLPAKSQRTVVKERRPARTLRLSTPPSDSKSHATSSRQNAGSTRTQQQRSSFSDSDLQRRLNASHSRQKATSANSSQPTASPEIKSSTRGQQQRSSLGRGDLKRQPNASRLQPQASSASSRQQSRTRAIPRQRQPARSVERSAPKPQAPAKTESATRSASSSRNTQQRSSFSGRDVQRQSSASHSRQQSSSSRVKRTPRAPSIQPSASRSRGSQSRAQRPQRQSVTRQSSSRQRGSANRQRQSRSSNRSGGKKRNN